VGNRRSGGEAPFGSWLKVSWPGRRMGGAERYRRPKEPREKEWRPSNEGSSSMGDSNLALKGDGGARGLVGGGTLEQNPSFQGSWDRQPNLEGERTSRVTSKTAVELVKAEGVKRGNGSPILDDHVMTDEESGSLGNAGAKSTAIMEGDVSERTVTDPTPSQKWKDSYVEKAHKDLALEPAEMGKSEKKDMVYVGSWDSVAGKMKYTCVEKRQACVQLDKVTASTPYFPRVYLEEHVPPDLSRKPSHPHKVVSDHAVHSDVAKGTSSPQVSERSYFQQDKPFEPLSGSSFFPNILRSSTGKISDPKKRARKGPLYAVGGSAKSVNGKGKRKADLVASEGGEGGHGATKKSKVPSVLAQGDMAVADGQPCPAK
jgi:hypothetical protein